MPRQRRGRCPQVARWVRRVACKSCAEFGAVPRLRSGLVPSECPLARTLLADVYVKCLGGRKTRIPASEDANLDGVLSPYVHVMTSCRRMRLDMSVRCMPTSCSGSQFDKVPRTSRGSVFALARVCTAPHLAPIVRWYVSCRHTYLCSALERVSALNAVRLCTVELLSSPV